MKSGGVDREEKKTTQRQLKCEGRETSSLKEGQKANPYSLEREKGLETVEKTSTHQLSTVKCENGKIRFQRVQSITRPGVDSKITGGNVGTKKPLGRKSSNLNRLKKGRRIHSRRRGNHNENLNPQTSKASENCSRKPNPWGSQSGPAKVATT